MSDRTPLFERLCSGLRAAGALQPVSVGATPFRPLQQTARGELRHYGDGEGPPLLLIYSLVNRAYLLDLQPDRSVIRRLIGEGVDVYLLDWREPDSMDRFAGLADYLHDDIAAAVAAVTAARGQTPHLAGVCQGGVLALCHAALQPDTIRSLTLLATPLNFATPDDPLARLAKHIDFQQLVDAVGNVPAAALNLAFAGLKPVELFAQRYLALAGLAEDEQGLTDFLRMERWMYDSPAQAGRAFLEFARDFYQRNLLYRGELTIDDEPVRPRRIHHPVFAAYARDDHLVPPAAARAVRRLLPRARLTTRERPGGHLSLFVGGRAHAQLYPELVAWLRSA
jgi:polyhydroxyalkanoate synthase